MSSHQYILIITSSTHLPRGGSLANCFLAGFLRQRLIVAGCDVTGAAVMEKLEDLGADHLIFWEGGSFFF